MTFQKFLQNIIFSLYKPLAISFGGWDPTESLNPFSGSNVASNLFSGPQQPAAPDYEGAARATAEGDLEMARVGAMANRPNQFTPWGTSTWTQDPNNQDLWTQNVTLSPEQQRLYQTGTQADIQMAELGLQGARQAGDIFQDPFSLESMGQMPNYQDQFSNIYGSMLSRVDQDIAKDRDAMESQLIASGIPKGSEAYNREMQRIDRQLTDARQQAELAATQQVGQRQQSDIENRRQQIAEMLTQRQTPLNEYSAFRTGTQVSMPNFPGVPQQQTTQGPDILGATSAQGQWDLAGWNADVARQNAILGAGSQLGAAYLGAG